MITRRSNYNTLLDNLKKISENYHVNEEGIICNKNNEEETNERILAGFNFMILYRMAYYATKQIAHDGSIDEKLYNNLVFMDYSTFNSFINNCVNECNMYNDIGGDEFSYIPYQELASYMLDNEDYKKIVVDYLKSVFKDTLSFEKGRRLSRKKD